MSVRDPLARLHPGEPNSDPADHAPHEFRWHLVATNDSLELKRGSASAPTVTIFTDISVVEEMAASTLNAQRAIDSNRLKIRGDLNRLAALSPALAILEQASRAAFDTPS